MNSKSKETFSQILIAVAPRNVKTLENKAHTAASLAVTHPQNEDIFRAIESGALRQIFRVLAEQPWLSDLSAAAKIVAVGQTAGVRLAAD